MRRIPNARAASITRRAVSGETLPRSLRTRPDSGDADAGLPRDVLQADPVHRATLGLAPPVGPPSAPRLLPPAPRSESIKTVNEASRRIGLVEQRARSTGRMVRTDRAVPRREDRSMAAKAEAPDYSLTGERAKQAIANGLAHISGASGTPRRSRASG